MLASRCSKMTARKLPRCGAGTPAKSTYCDLPSFGPALFEICWPDIYLGGPYGPVKDEMYWPELVRRSEKCAGPAGQCLCRGLRPPSRAKLGNRLVYYIKLQCPFIFLSVTPPPFFSTRPSDRNQIWHTYSDRYGTGSHLKKLTHPTPGVISHHL